MSNRVPIWLALSGNLGVVALTVGALGLNSAGAHAAARNTARFSALWCAIALASPGFFQRFCRWSEGRFIQGFVAAHLVHFVSDAALLLTFERTHIAEHPGQSVAVIAIGFSLMIGLGLTAASARDWHKIVRLGHPLRGACYFLRVFHHVVRPLRELRYFWQLHWSCVRRTACPSGRRVPGLRSYSDRKLTAPPRPIKSGTSSTSDLVIATSHLCLHLIQSMRFHKGIVRAVRLRDLRSFA
jgi:hypothetical protein